MIGRIIAVCLIPVLFYLVYVAGHWGMADVYSRPVINQLKEWRRGNLILKEDDWGIIQSELIKAIELDPKNPELYEYAGMAFEGPYVTSPIKDDAARSERIKARDFYKQSIQLRPSWPFAWSDYVLVKFRLGEIDEEFYHALYRADELGPWEPSVQHTTIEIGLVYWQSLSRQDRKFILSVIDKSLNHADREHSVRILDMINRYNFLGYICLLLNKHDYVDVYCKKNSL